MVLLESRDLALGGKAPDFNLKGIDDQMHSLSDYRDSKGLVIVFMCNHCPYVQAIWSRLVDLQEKYAEQGISFIAINPNSNPAYPEDSFDKMKEYAREYQMNFDYLVDEDQSVAKAYEAQCTPDIFVYDENRSLFYHGRIDDNWKDEAGVDSRDLDKALSSLLNSMPLEGDQHPSMGCSIKWVD